MAATNDELLALYLKLKRQVESLEPGSGSGSGGATGAELTDLWNAIALNLKTYLSNPIYEAYVDATEVTQANAWATYMEALTLVLSGFKDQLESLVILTEDDVEHIIADYLASGELELLLVDFIRANDIVAGTVTTQQLLAYSATFLSAITNSLTAQGVAAFNIDSDHLTIKNAAIKNAMIESINASKIVAGSIDTSKVHIQSPDNHVLIADGTITISDGTNIRVQIGEDANGDYNMVVCDEDGEVMWSALGIEAAAIKKAIIVDDMISENANISANKINIASVINSIESNGSLTVKSTQIEIDANNQKLSTWLNTINTWKTNIGEAVTTLDTQISVIQGELDTFLKEEDLETLETGMELLQTQYSNLNQTVSGLSSTVSSHTTSINTLNTDVQTATTKATQAKQTADGFQATINAQNSTIRNLEDAAAVTAQTVQAANTQLTANAELMQAIQNSTYLKQDEVTALLESYEARFESTAQGISYEITSQVSSAMSDYLKAENFNRWFTVTTDGLRIGSSQNPVQLLISNDAIKFYNGNTLLGYWDGSYFHCGDIYVEVNHMARFGNFAWVPGADGSLVLKRLT